MEQLFWSDDPQIQQNLLRLERTLKSPRFLSGLVLSSKLDELAKSFIITTNIVECSKMIGSEEIYDSPKPWAYQCFNEILEEEIGNISYKTLPKELTLIIKKESIKPNFRTWESIAFQFISDKFHEHNVENTLSVLAKRNEHKLDEITWAYDSVFQSVIDSIVYMLITAACIGGYEKSVVSERMLEAFECGGIPGGWVGPLPKDGGLAKDCLQLFHLGK